MLRRRQWIAVLALVGFFLSAYLLLYHLGVYGELVCGEEGSCETVQASRFALLLGMPVAGWGLAWYAAVFGAALAELRAGEGARRGAGWLLAMLATGGIAFSAYLTYAELFVLHAICRWCVGSAILTLLIFGAAVVRPRGAEAVRRGRFS